MSRDWTSAGRCLCSFAAAARAEMRCEMLFRRDCVLVKRRWCFVVQSGVRVSVCQWKREACTRAAESTAGTLASLLARRLVAQSSPSSSRVKSRTQGAFVSRHAGAVTSIHITSRLPCRATARFTILGSSRNNHPAEPTNSTQWHQKILAHSYAQLVKSAE